MDNRTRYLQVRTLVNYIGKHQLITGEKPTVNELVSLFEVDRDVAQLALNGFDLQQLVATERKRESSGSADNS